MTAIEIATGMIDKLQKENRECLDALHDARQTIKHSERQLAEKERLIKVLEERIRMGTDGILQVSNREKELTIKHLELQIQKLLRENEELELKLEGIKAELCAKCETKLLLKENSENKNIRSFKSTAGKTSSTLYEKKTSQNICPNRLKSLERIIEHKDKRIMHLSKEVQRLTKIEKELTQKIYRLTKLLPLSRMPPETLTDCLLKEIQLLESQKQSHDKFQSSDDLNKLKRDKLSVKDYVSSSKVSFRNSSERLKKAPTSNITRSAMSMPDFEANDVLDTPKAESEVLFKKLQKLCSDVNELKRLFAFESDKLSQGLHSTATEYNIFKNHLEEIINNLNDVVQSILNNNFLNVQDENVFASPSNSDDKFVISCLQKRLQESLGMVSEYERENKTLQEELSQLKKQLAAHDIYHIRDKKFGNETITDTQCTNDVRKLHETIRVKNTQLEAAESHINTCQKFIEELQKNIKKTAFDSLNMPSGFSTSNEKPSNFCEQQNKMLQTKLNVAERNIRTCESVIEQLQNSVRRLEEENVRIESELHMVKSQKMSEVNNQASKNLQPKFSSGETQIGFLKKINLELQDKIKALEEVNLKLEKDMKNYEEKNIILEASEQEKSLLKTKLDASEKQICSLEKSMETLQDKLTTVENEKKQLEDKLKSIAVANDLTGVYESEIAALKSDLNEKEKENKNLEGSLHTLENKAKEMSFHRRNLLKEIENLCKVLMEKEDEDSFRRKAIYKAAVLRSAQALLKLDDNYNFQPEEFNRNTALEEMKHQIQVYLTEVARIHELVTIKEHNRDELLKEYLDLNDDDGNILKPSLSLHHQSHFQNEPVNGNLQSSPDILHDPQQSDLPAFAKEAKTSKPFIDNYVSDATLAELKAVQEELVATKSVTTYLLTSCTRLEELLAKERVERAKSERELEVYQETIKELMCQLNTKNSTAKRLNSFIELMRSKECNDEITLEQLKSEIKWLVDENQKIFERVTVTQAELCQCKEENSRIQNELDSLKRQLLNEKYENAKVNNELKHLRLQISSQSNLNDTN